MKIDQLNNFTSDKINDLLESRFGQRIDLTNESTDNLHAFQHAMARELAEMESSIGFNRSMNNPKFVENRLILDLINRAIAEKKGRDHDDDGDIDSDDYMAGRDKAIKKAMGKDDEEETEEGMDDKRKPGEPTIHLNYHRASDKEFLLKYGMSKKDYAKKRDKMLNFAAGVSKAKEDAKVKTVRGNMVDIEDPDKPGQTTTIETTKTDLDVDDAGEI